mmetsp:Transcript_38287/g.95908  ORF Transcript_38287/g.95908 Transcript_38287/m.95908 type:complete len:236 (-) Transcript_38287:13-720(-)
MRLAAQGVEDARQLHSDVASADDGDLLGLVLQLEEAVRADCVLLTRQPEWLWVPPRGYEDVGGGDLQGAAGVGGALDTQTLGTGEGRFADVFGDGAFLEVCVVDGVELLDVGVPLVLDGLPVELDAARVDVVAEVVGLMHHLGDHGRVEHDLLGHAAHIDTRAAPPAVLGHANLGAIARRPPGCRDAPRTATYDEEIEVLRHPQGRRGERSGVVLERPEMSAKPCQSPGAPETLL